MKGLFIGLFALLIAFAPRPLSAEDCLERITIKGPGLAAPIEINDQSIARYFNVWTGLGTSTHEPEGMIVNWAQGAVAERPQGLTRYEVSFYWNRITNEGPAYVVFYEYAPSIEQGYVYLPGPADEWFKRNVRTIYRGVEGSWFRASRRWEEIARPLIAKTQ
jgi:hypothetical protein